MTQSKFFVLSDVHGCYAEFMQALSHWNRETETLVVLGDMVDRGPHSLEVVQELMKLKTELPEQVVVLQGNHDAMLTSWLLDTHKDDLGFYYTETHVETLKSFFGLDASGRKKFKKSSRQQRAEHVLYSHAAELRWLKSLPLFHEEDHCLFVHAGINMELGENWHMDTKSMLWIRNPFLYSKKKAEKRVFFGHTPTSLVRNEQDNHDVWVSEQGDKVGLDGGVSMGGQLNAVRLDEFGNVTDTVVVPSALARV